MNESETEITPLSNDESTEHQPLQVKGHSADIPEAPDGGYGWVIVGCAFMCIFIIDGIGSTYSLLLPELNNHLETIPALSSMGNSLLFGALMLMGMPTSYFINKFGCRPVAFVGACIAGGGIAISSTVTSIWLFLSTFGVIGGIGIGMVYLPSIITVNAYFNKRRGVAQGILNSGSGFGILILSQLMKVFLDEYGWRGTVLILSGFAMQLCISSLLMRPLYTNSKSADLSSKGQKVQTSNETEVIDIYENVLTEKYGDKPQDVIISTRCSGNFNQVECAESVQCVFSSVPNIPSEPFLPQETCKSKQYLSLQCVKAIAHKLKKRKEYNPLHKQDIFYSVNICKLVHGDTVDKISGKADLSKELHTDEESVMADGSCRSGLCEKSLLTNRAFLLLALGAMLTQMAQYIPVIFLGDYALQIGLNRGEISIILTIFGIVNTLGRLLAGALTNIPRLSPLCICNIGNYMCALTLFLFPLCTSFWTLAMFAGCHALFVGFFPPMQPLMTVDYLGLKRLTRAFGLITFIKGPAAIFGPPIAGGLYQQTQSYAVSNAFSGGLFFISAFLQMLIPFFNKDVSRYRDDYLSVERERETIAET